MDDTYNEAMERIAGQGEDDRQLAERVLSWIIYAFTPLSLRELQNALSVRPNVNSIDSEALEDDTIFISVCAGLVFIDEQSQLIHLIQCSNANSSSELSLCRLHCTAISRKQARVTVPTWPGLHFSNVSYIPLIWFGKSAGSKDLILLLRSSSMRRRIGAAILTEM
jgi:hypothetical protein